jgi:predicted dehydrogenase
MEGFADVILYGASATGAGVDDGAAALRALSAISHSAKTGERVALSDAPGNV